ncbi:hypothetical protein GCM10010988_22900 [Cnuibacter physcomitrellae]|nr:hypothetical protein GCM10010988_22900 [Cnuibacter physcomitrellae]
MVLTTDPAGRQRRLRTIVGASTFPLIAPLCVYVPWLIAQVLFLALTVFWTDDPDKTAIEYDAMIARNVSRALAALFSPAMLVTDALTVGLAVLGIVVSIRRLREAGSDYPRAETGVAVARAAAVFAVPAIVMSLVVVFSGGLVGFEQTLTRMGPPGLGVCLAGLVLSVGAGALGWRWVR